MPVLSELKRRNVFKVAAAYAVVAWLLLQIADVLLPALQLPAWTITLVAALLVLGFPIALVLSWAYDIGPGGVQRTEATPTEASQPRGPSRTVDFAIIGVLSVALAFVVFNYVLVENAASPEIAAEASPNVPRPTDPTTETDEVSGRLPNSVAVLPLDNLSPNPDDAYFTAGFHEEILSQLGNLRNLSVISRTSVERYVDSDLSLPQIAAELNVETVMEGSVRYAGDQVRVTLQLIDPRTDAHLWSDSYDGDLSDIFAIQADIAMNVANALQAEFSLEEQQRIEKIPTSDPIAYTLYLRALDQSAQRTIEGAIDDLNSAIELDDRFADAYSDKAWTIANGLPLTAENERIIIESARTALDLDPTQGTAHLALALLHESGWRGPEALEELRLAYELSPADPYILLEYGRFNRYVGNYDAAVEANLRAVQLDPNNRLSHSQLGASLQADGQYERAAAAFRTGISLAPSNVGTYVQFAQLEADRGRNEEALRQLQSAEALGTQSPVRFAQMAASYARIGRPEDAARLFRRVETIDAEDEQSDALWSVMYLSIGDYDEAYDRLVNAMENQVPAGQFSYNELRLMFTNLRSNVWGLPVLEEPRFRELRERIFALN